MQDAPNRRQPFAPHAHRGTLPDTIKVHPGKGLTAIVLSQRVLGVFTHWVGQRSLPCNSRDGEHCLVDHKTSGRYRWQGWVAVLPISGQVPGFVSITENVAKKNPYLRTAKTLRGATIHLWRSGENKESQMLCKLSAESEPRSDLPIPPSTVEFLCRLWNIPYMGKLPEGIEGWPLEQEYLKFHGGPVIDHLADPLAGTIWEGMPMTMTDEEAASMAAEVWRKQRGRLSL